MRASWSDLAVVVNREAYPERTIGATRLAFLRPWELAPVVRAFLT